MKNWLIKALGGYTADELEFVKGISELQARRIQALKKTKLWPRDAKGRFFNPEKVNND